MVYKKTLKRLVILDSHAIIHRAYHALPDFSSSKGEPTGALYGLISMLLKITADLKPDYIVAARDLPGPTNRHTLYKEYKGTRPKADKELVSQLEAAPKVFAAFGIPLHEAAGFEADDVIGTIVKKLVREKNIEIVIASGDLDTLQLVEGSRVKVYTMRQGLSDTVLYDEGKVRERFGFVPALLPDYKGLRGDPSDNIKGIAGVGEKTATELVKKFGSLEKIYGALKKDAQALEKAGFTKRSIELVVDGEKDALFSKKLAVILESAPISFSLPKREWCLADYAAAVTSLCDEFEFRSLKERVLKATGAKTSEEKSNGTLFPSVDAQLLKEVSLALWLLHSDTTNPTLEDIFQYAHTRDFEKARKNICEELEKTGRLKEVYETIERSLVPVVERMNAVGVLLDVPYLKGLAKEYEKERRVVAGRIMKCAGREFNVSSPRQLAEVLFDELKLAPARQKLTSGGARTTREEELAKLSGQHPIVDDVLLYRELKKLLSTYVSKLPKLIGSDGRLHTEFVQSGTTTGRMSSQNPNMQNIPIQGERGKHIRRAFVAPPGSVLAALDYSQIELRLAAGLSGDKNLVSVFKSGGDVHSSVASLVFSVPRGKVDYEMRRRAKVINFGILYGMGVVSLRSSLGADVEREEAQTFLDNYFKNFSDLARFIEKTKTDAARRGFTETFFGRRRYFSGLHSPLPQVRAQAERMAINAPIQGSSADITKLAMVNVDHMLEKRGWGANARLVLQIHDELVYELDEKHAEEIAREIKGVMESVVPASKLSGVPIVADASLGPNWGELKKLEARS